MNILNIFSFVLLMISVSIKSLDAPHYTQDLFSLAKKIDQKTGVVVIAYNRPHYLKLVLAALEKTPEASSSMPFIFILDGGVNATQEENEQLIHDVAIKNKYVVVRSSGYGCGRSLIDARRFMFEWCKFDRIIFIEDDLVVSPEYLTLTLSLHDWAQKHYDNIGVVQCFNVCHMDVDEKKLYLNDVEETFGSFWGYCLDKKVYFSIKCMMDEHEQRHLINIPDGQCNSSVIASWIMRHIKQKKKNIFKKSFYSSITYEKLFSDIVLHLKKNRTIRRDGQDFEMRVALYKNGYIKIATTVNRALYIGKKGVHHRPQYWERKGYSIMTLEEHIDDTKIKEFKMHEKCEKCI